MALSQERIDELAAKLAAAMDAPKPSARCVALTGLARAGCRSDGMDEITRESHLRMIRQLCRSFRGFNFELIVAQATMGKAGVEDLDDDELVALHRDLDRARECIRDNVTFEDAGLVRAGTTEA